MKSMKKLMALLLALTLMLALGTTAFAASSDGATGTITVLNPIEGETYTAYKIFDVTYDDNNDTIPLTSGDAEDHYAYTIDSDSPWFATVAAYAGGAADTDGVYSDNGLTLTPAVNTASPIKYVVTADDTFSAADFAEELKDVLTGITDEDAVELAGDPPTATGLDLGYWFVSSTNGSLCNLTTTNPSQNIYDKNQPLDIDKTVDDEDNTVEVGQVLTYTLTADLPKDVTGYEEFHFVIGDTMTEGLTYRCIDSITIGGVAQTVPAAIPGITYKHGGIDATDADMNGFSIDIDFATKNTDGNLVYASALGKTVVITYRAIVNENAIERGVETNTATLKYSNDPNDSSSYKEVPDVTVDVYTLNIAVNKVSPDDEPLADAKFVLYKEVEGVKHYYLYGERDGFDDVQWVALPSGIADVESALKADTGFCTVRTSDSNGVLDDDFEGLDAGTYYLEEIKAPAGFNLPADPFIVVITKNVDATTKEVTFTATVDGIDVSDGMTSASLTVNAEIENQSGTILPSTGGFGTTMLIVLGSVLFMATAIVLVTKKRMYNEGR